MLTVDDSKQRCQLFLKPNVKSTAYLPRYMIKQAARITNSDNDISLTRTVKIYFGNPP